MSRWALAATAALILPLTSGCAVVAVPALAGAAMAGKTAGVLDRDTPAAAKETEQAVDAVAVKAAGETPTGEPVVGTSGGVPVVAAAPVAPELSPSHQYLYGSGEAAAQSLQSYLALANFLISRQSDISVGQEIGSVVLARGSTLAAPRFESCAGKPPAIILDIDETAILNAGYEQYQSGRTYDQTVWERWEQTGAGSVVAVPGAADAVKVARGAKIVVVFNSNRSAANAAGTVAALDRAGLGPATHGDTLWLKGDVDGTGGKDARRWAISQRYCVIAMVGDQLGDFSDLFNDPALGLAQRRDLIASRGIETLWGQGWFMLPNPVYGTAVRGTPDEVFPPATRWSGPSAPQPSPTAP